MTAAPAPPAIVLVRPQLGANIGAVARAMLNFGLTDLRLVAPRDGWPNPDAGPSAAGADTVLANARVFGSVADAIADRAVVYATTVRHRGLTKTVSTPQAAVAAMRAEPSAILFGPERSGLETEDVARATAILTIPVNPDFASLNIAQAVLVCAWEWTRAGDATPSARLDNYAGPAPAGEVEGLVGQLDAALTVANFFNVPSREAATRLAVRNLLTRPGFSANEVRTLRGIVHALVEGRRGHRPIGSKRAGVGAQTARQDRGDDG